MGLVLLPLAVLTWVVFCGAAGLVATAMIGGTANYVKGVLIGVAIGIVCGLVRLFAITSLGDLLDPSGLQPSDALRGLLISLASILISTGFAAATGAAAGGIVGQSRRAVRGCMVVSASYGLMIGVAGLIVSSIAQYWLAPDFEGLTLNDPTVTMYIVFTGALDVGSKAGLTVILFLWVRKRGLAN